MSELSGKPLNGEKTHPLTDHSREWLRRLADGPIRAGMMNAGVKDRLTRKPNPLAELVERNIDTHPNRRPQHTKTAMYLRITEAGRKELERG